MYKKYWLFIALLVLAPVLNAQTFEGEWLGTLVQPDNPPYENYTVQLTMHQVDDVVTGITQIHLEGHPEIYARMEFKAAVNKAGDEMLFREYKLLDHFHFATYEWCLKRGVLSIENIGGGIYQLSGVWEGFTKDIACSPGYLKVEKVDPFNNDYDVDLSNLPITDVDLDDKKDSKNPDATPDQQEKEKPSISHGELEGRAITRLREVDVFKEQITAYVWDVNKEDGDVISLQFNGKWILKDYYLKKEKKAIQLKIEPGKENRLVLFAENLGSIPPNTCAINFNDGKQSRNLSLISDKVSCGALEFVFQQD